MKGSIQGTTSEWVFLFFLFLFSPSNCQGRSVRPPYSHTISVFVVFTFTIFLTVIRCGLPRIPSRTRPSPSSPLAFPTIPIMSVPTMYHSARSRRSRTPTSPTACHCSSPYPTLHHCTPQRRLRQPRHRPNQNFALLKTTTTVDTVISITPNLTPDRYNRPLRHHRCSHRRTLPIPSSSAIQARFSEPIVTRTDIIDSTILVVGIVSNTNIGTVIDSSLRVQKLHTRTFTLIPHYSRHILRQGQVCRKDVEFRYFQRPQLFICIVFIFVLGISI